MREYPLGMSHSNTYMNSAIIALYQRLALPPKGLAEVHGPWYHAIQTCLNACDDMSTVIRAINDADLENMSPHMIFCIFVAARFYLGKFCVTELSKVSLIKTKFMQKSCRSKFLALSTF